MRGHQNTYLTVTIITTVLRLILRILILGEVCLPMHQTNSINKTPLI
jgi:hypothetical protein